MSEEKDFYKKLIDNLFDGVYFVDRERKITYWNKGAERITGYEAQKVVGHHCYDNMLNHVTSNGVLLCVDNNCPIAACMQDGKPREAEIFLHHAEGYRVPVCVRAAPLYDEQGNIIGAVETFNNNTAVVNFRQQVRELRRKIHIDPVTGVRNRHFLEGRLRALVAEFDHQHSTAGLFLLDVDHFKEINDTYGHEAGDKVLQMVAATLNNNLRTTDVLGRWGGDEFMVILHDVTSLDTLQSIAEKLRIMVECSRLDYENHSLTTTLSIGTTCLLPEDTPETIVRRADNLMYQSKQAGRNRVSVG